VVNDIFEALDRIVAWLGFVRKRQEERSAQMERALEAVMIAANKTRSYLAVKRMRDAVPNRRREYRDQQAENELRDAWREAGSRLHNVARDDETAWLARRCFEKSVYWADPDHINWEDDAAVQAAGIKLDSIVNDILDLMCCKRGNGQA
jgi:hypothetical protein